MKILMVCNDELTPYFDKRILDLAQILIGDGNEVIIFTVGQFAKLQMTGNPTICQLPRNPEASSSFIQNAGKSQFPITNSLTRSLESSMQSLKLKLGRILPTRVKRIIYRLLVYMKGLSRNLPIAKKYSSTHDFYEIDAGFLIENLSDNDADVILGCDLPGAIAAMGIRNRNQFFWYDAHEYYSEQGWIRNKVNVERLLHWENMVVNSCDVITTVSFGLAEVYRNRYPEAKQINVLTNASDPARLSQYSEMDLRQKLRIKKDEKICIFHGGLSGSHRNLELFVNLFLQIAAQDWHLVLLGYDASRVLQEANRMQDRVHLCDAVANSELGFVLGQCDAIVMPYSVTDINTLFGFPNKLGDAISLRIPFIYNEDLKEIALHAKRFNIGVPFHMDRGHESVQSIGEALKSISRLDPLWTEASYEIGWEAFRSNTKQIMRILEEKDSSRQKTT